MDKKTQIIGTEALDVFVNEKKLLNPDVMFETASTLAKAAASKPNEVPVLLLETLVILMSEITGFEYEYILDKVEQMIDSLVSSKDTKMKMVFYLDSSKHKIVN